MSLKCIVLNERGQTQMATFYVICFMTFCKGQSYESENQVCGFRGSGWEGEEIDYKWVWGNLLAWWKWSISWLWCGYMSVWVCWNSELYTQTGCVFKIICYFFLKKQQQKANETFTLEDLLWLRTFFSDFNFLLPQGKESYQVCLIS